MTLLWKVGGLGVFGFGFGGLFGRFFVVCPPPGIHQYSYLWLSKKEAKNLHKIAHKNWRRLNHFFTYTLKLNIDFYLYKCIIVQKEKSYAYT